MPRTAMMRYQARYPSGVALLFVTTLCQVVIAGNAAINMQRRIARSIGSDRKNAHFIPPAADAQLDVPGRAVAFIVA